MLLLSKKTIIHKNPTYLLFPQMYLLVASVLITLLLFPNFVFSATPQGAFGNDRYLEPRLKKQKEEDERLIREQKRKALEEKTTQENQKSRRYNFGTGKKEKTEEQIAFEENKQYMTYWQRFKFSWENAESFQDIFDLSLAKAYAPAIVRATFLNIRSGPGRSYPVIYIAERDEIIDFTAIRTEWYQIRTADGHFGWLHMDDLPGNLDFEVDVKGFGFSDQAKVVATRGTPVDIGFAGGYMGDAPVMLAYIKNRNNYFMSTEFEIGLNRGAAIQNDFISVNLLAHPFSDLEYQPHFLIGFGQMYSDYLVSGTKESEDGLLLKAGIGVSKNLSQRLRFRADLSQYSVENKIDKFNHYTLLTVGSSYVWGSSTDEIFNRSIGEKVSVTDLEMTLTNGTINLNNIGSVSISGLRAGYHISEDHFFEASYMMGSKDYRNISFAVGRNLLPAEYVISWRNRNNYWPAQLFALAGTGLQSIDKDEQVSVILGAGVRLAPLRRLALRADMRENIVQQQADDNGYLGKYLKNSELTLGLSYYF